MNIDVPEAVLDALADRIADRLAARIGELTENRSPWMTTLEAIEHSRIPEGTFRKLAAEGRIPSHGGRTKTFHRAEVDEAILGYARRSKITELRRAS